MLAFVEPAANRFETAAVTRLRDLALLGLGSSRSPASTPAKCRSLTEATTISSPAIVPSMAAVGQRQPRWRRQRRIPAEHEGRCPPGLPPATCLSPAARLAASSDRPGAQTDQSQVPAFPRECGHPQLVAAAPIRSSAFRDRRSSGSRRQSPACRQQRGRPRVRAVRRPRPLRPEPWFRSRAGTLTRPAPASVAHLHSEIAGLSAEIARDALVATRRALGGRGRAPARTRRRDRYGRTEASRRCVPSLGLSGDDKRGVRALRPRVRLGQPERRTPAACGRPDPR